MNSRINLDPVNASERDKKSDERDRLVRISFFIHQHRQNVEALYLEEMEVAWRRCLGDCRYGGIKGRYLGDGS